MYPASPMESVTVNSSRNEARKMFDKGNRAITAALGRLAKDLEGYGFLGKASVEVTVEIPDKHKPNEGMTFVAKESLEFRRG